VDVLREILRGGLDKMREAGVLLVGGHSVEDDEIKYGLSVTGTIHPDKVFYNRGAKPGDCLILTKPLGTGIMSTALKCGGIGKGLLAQAITAMTQLNKRAAELMIDEGGVNACTDITGFGLLGHAFEMIEGSETSLRINSAAVPVFPGIRKLMESGFIPGGLYRNKDFRIAQIDIADSCPGWLLDVFFDPQTAGGLLISLPREKALRLTEKMHREGIVAAAIIGEVVAENAGRIFVY